MASFSGRLDRLRRLYATSSVDERAKLAEIYEGFAQLEREWRWLEGTAVAIMTALMNDTSHTFAWYEPDGSRSALRIGPFHRDRRGAINWGDPIAHGALAFDIGEREYEESYGQVRTKASLPRSGGAFLCTGIAWSAATAASGGLKPAPGHAVVRVCSVGRHSHGVAAVSRPHAPPVFLEAG
jgi:hypothetical protein